MTKEIRLPAPHPRFRPRLDGGPRRPGHPGTAVRIGEELYEIIAAERSAEEWVYRLEPWTGLDTIRVYVEWSETAEREFAAGLRDERVREKKRLAAWLGQAFLGFLPADRQERLQQEVGLEPARATLWSAALETLAASPFAVLFVINFAAGGTASLGVTIPTWAGFLALIVMGDGIFRLAAVISTGEPMGSLFLVLLNLRLRSQGPQAETGDEILTMGEELNIISHVPKVWWETAGGVTYAGEPYVLAGSSGERGRFSYRFRKGGAGFPVLDPAFERLRNRSSDLSYVFAPLWGYLSPDLQKALEFYGRYRPRPYVLLSIGLNLLLALAFVGPGLRSLSLGVFAIKSLVLLAVAIVLVAECVVRLLKLLGEGKTTGSLLGFLVKPVYRFAIRDQPGGPN